LSVQGSRDAESVLRFIASQDVLLTAARLLKPGSVFLQLEGPGNENITLDGGDISKAATPVAYKDGATERTLKLRI